jgi:broad specificity phosphatase PhoE
MPLPPLSLSLQIARFDAAATHRAALPRHHVARWLRHALGSAVQTAEIVANVAARTVTLDHDLIELDFGSFEGQPVRELMLRHGKNNAQGLVDMLPADAEPWDDVASRAIRSVRQWLDRHPEQEILFVCHDAVMQSMAQRLTGTFFKNGHGRPFRFMRTDDRWTVVEVG